MDLRVKRTEENLINAFIELRAKKPIERITVKELTDLAVMNKSTFYRHYKDIYDLSDKIENELISDCISTITDTDILFSSKGVYQIVNAFHSKSEIINIIFSGSREDAVIHKIHKNLCKKIYQLHPEYQDDLETNIFLTTLIYGNFQAYFKYKDEDFDTLIECISKTTKIFNKIDC